MSTHASSAEATAHVDAAVTQLGGPDADHPGMVALAQARALLHRCQGQFPEAQARSLRAAQRHGDRSRLDSPATAHLDPRSMRGGNVRGSVATLFGMDFGETSGITRVVYGLVGLAGLWLAARFAALLGRDREQVPVSV